MASMDAALVAPAAATVGVGQYKQSTVRPQVRGPALVGWLARVRSQLLEDGPRRIGPRWFPEWVLSSVGGLPAGGIWIQLLVTLAGR